MNQREQMKRSHFQVKQLFPKQLFPKRYTQLLRLRQICCDPRLLPAATVNQLSVAIVSLYSSITQGLASIGVGGA